MTEKLFYTDSHLQEFTAEVVSCRPCDNGYEAVLSRTAFFPEGGGQAADTDILSPVSNATLPVLLTVDIVDDFLGKSDGCT